MIRKHWSLLFCAAIVALGLPPTLAGQVLNPNFQAAEISYFDLNDPHVSDGLMEFNNTGLVISDVAACSYWHDNVPGSTDPANFTLYTGYSAVVEAVRDGMAPAANAQGVLLPTWTGSQGITGLNAAEYPSTYCIAFAYAGTLADVGLDWGGVALTPSDSSALLLRETYVGDANLDGSVDATDSSVWQSHVGTVPSGTSIGPVSGDFLYCSFLNGQPVDTTYDENAMLNNYGAPFLGPGPYSYVIPTPEPTSAALLGSALLGLGLVYLRRHRRKG